MTKETGSFIGKVKINKKGHLLWEPEGIVYRHELSRSHHIVDKVQVYHVGNPNLSFYHRPGAIVNPKITSKCGLHFPAGPEGDLITPTVINIHAIEQYILVKQQP